MCSYLVPCFIFSAPLRLECQVMRMGGALADVFTLNP